MIDTQFHFCHITLGVVTEIDPLGLRIEGVFE